MADKFKASGKIEGSEKTMIFPFDKVQIDFLQKTFGVNPYDDMNTDAQLHLEDMLSDYLQLHGVNEAGDGENAIGRMCADILAVIAANDR